MKKILFLISILIVQFLVVNTIYAKVSYNGQIAVTSSRDLIPSPTPKQEVVDSGVLFWPMAPGKKMDNSFYWVKILKEKIRGFFIFSKAKKAAYNTFLGTKRTLEAEAFLNTNNEDLANKTFDVAISEFENASIKLEQAKANGSVGNDVKEEITSRTNNLEVLLKYLLNKFPDSNGKIQETLDKVVNLHNKV